MANPINTEFTPSFEPVPSPAMAAQPTTSSSLPQPVPLPEASNQNNLHGHEIQPLNEASISRTFKAQLSSGAAITVSIPHTAEDKGSQAALNAISFARTWLTETLNDPESPLHHLKTGEGFALSRREINQLAKEGQLSETLADLYKNSSFPRSVVIIKVAEDDSGHDMFEFYAKRHTHEPQSDVRSEMDKKGIQKVFTEGGINQLTILDGSNGLVLLNRQLKKNKNSTLSKINESKLIKQIKTEEALAEVPCVFNKRCLSASLTTQSTPPGIKTLNGAVYVKMEGGDACKTLGYNPRKMSLPKDAPLEPEKALPIFSRIAQGISEMHTRGIAWLDMKPENLLFDNEGKVYIADFDTCIHLHNPTPLHYKDMLTGEETEENELTEFNPVGTAPFLSPWVCGLSMAETFQQNSVLQVAQNAKKQLRLANENLKRASDPVEIERIDALRRDIVGFIYHKNDTYAFSLFAYLLMTGKYPDYLIANKDSLSIKTANTVNNRDHDYIQFETPDPGSNALSIREALSGAVDRGYPAELANLVWRGLSSNPDEVPPITDFLKFH